MTVPDDRVRRVLDALTAMKETGEAITFTAVAERAKVSRWWLYKADSEIRDIVAAARGYPVLEPDVHREAKRLARNTFEGELARLRREVEHLRTSNGHLMTRLDFQRAEFQVLRNKLDSLAARCGVTLSDGASSNKTDTGLSDATSM